MHFAALAFLLRHSPILCICIRFGSSSNHHLFSSPYLNFTPFCIARLALVLLRILAWLAFDGIVLPRKCACGGVGLLWQREWDGSRCGCLLRASLWCEDTVVGVQASGFSGQSAERAGRLMAIVLAVIVLIYQQTFHKPARSFPDCDDSPLYKCILHSFFNLVLTQHHDSSLPLHR